MSADDEYRPTLEDVGALILVRTVDSVGYQTGTFTADTRPTDSQVEVLIDKAMSDVARAIGTDIPEILWENARHVASKCTVMYIELSLYPHEIRGNISSYQEWKVLYEEELTELIAAVGAIEAGATGEDAPGNMPRYAYSVPSYIYSGTI